MLGDGFGAAFSFDSLQANISNCLFENNISPAAAGAIYLSVFAKSYLSDNIIRNNSGGKFGGGLLLNNGELVTQNDLWEFNAGNHCCCCFIFFCWMLHFFFCVCVCVCVLFSICCIVACFLLLC